MTQRHRVVIIGGGFGGLQAARNLRSSNVHVTLIDRRNFHLFQALLYQVATGALSPANIAAPLRAVLKRQANTQVLLGNVADIDAAGRRVILEDGEIPYDSLIVAAGARHHYFGHEEWESLAPGLKTIEDATEIRRRVLLAFEEAEREPDPTVQQQWLTFVVVGAGATGVELAGAIAELAHFTLKRNFRNCDPSKARIFLIETADRVLPPFVPELSRKAASSLAKLRVTVRTNCAVVDIRAGAVTVQSAGQHEILQARTVLWAAGVRASPLGKVLADRTKVQLDRAGRPIVQPDCTLPGHPEIFVIGDLANFTPEGGALLPGVAQVAMQQGAYAARVIKDRLEGRATPPFRYRDLGMMATIGRDHAVADLHWIRFGGRLAWLAWLFVHLIQTVQFESRILILLQWGWNYLTRNRSARLITGETPPEQAGK